MKEVSMKQMETYLRYASPRGTRDGTAGLKGRIVYIVHAVRFGWVFGVFTSRAKARYHAKQQHHETHIEKRIIR